MKRIAREASGKYVPGVLFLSQIKDKLSHAKR